MLGLLAILAGAVANSAPRGRAGAPSSRILRFPDGGFEAGGKGWRIVSTRGVRVRVSTEQAASGRRSLEIVDASTAAGSNVTSPPLALPGEGVYEIRGKVYPVSGNGLGIYYRFLDRHGKARGQARHLVGLGGSQRRWRDFGNSVQVPPGAAAIQLWIHSYRAVEVSAFLDDLALRVIALRKDGVSPACKRDMAVIEQRLREAALAGKLNPAQVKRWIHTLGSDGAWPDIDYRDRNRTAWKPARHVNRLLLLARAWRRRDSPLRRDPALGAAFLRAFDFWTRKRLRCPNWWYNVIGVPRLMYRAMILAEPLLDSARMRRGLHILEAARLGMTGENLVWVAEVTIARGCLARDPWTVRQAFARMAEEIRITTGEGIQPDYSFYQHGSQFYNGGYGRGFSHDCAWFASLARGTCFEFPPERLRILVNYLLDGQQWLVRDGTFDYNACGREIARKSGGRSGSLVDACRFLLQLPEGTLPRRTEIERFLARLQKPTPENALVGNRMFPRVDAMVHHRAAFMASLRMTSRRTLQTETCNSENLLGAHLSDGLMYLYRRGDEYRGVFPVWDWNRLPGITVELSPAPPVTRSGRRGERDFAGGASDSLYGAAAMDFARGKLKAHKAWFFFDRLIVALGAEIACTSPYPVATVLNQCRLIGPVTAASAGKTAQTLAPGEYRFTAPGWVHQDGVGYVFPGPCRRRLRFGKRTGNWRRINHVYAPTPVSLGVFELEIDHGKAPKAAAYQYFVLPGASAPETAEFATHWQDTVRLLHNDSALQAVVQRRTGIAGIVFWKPRPVRLPGGLEIAPDHPCIVLCRGPALSGTGPLEIALADPAEKYRRIRLRLNRDFQFERAAPAHVRRGRSAAGSKDLVFTLPLPPHSGETRLARLVLRSPEATQPRPR